MKLFGRKNLPTEGEHAGDLRSQKNIVRIEPASNAPKKNTMNPMEIRMRDLATYDMSSLSDLSGFIGACLVDGDSGMMIAQEGGDGFDLEAAAALNTEVVKAKLRAVDALGLNDTIEDILITLGKQFHLIRPLSDDKAIFLYLALERSKSNLALARVALRKIDADN